MSTEILRHTNLTHANTFGLEVCANYYYPVTSSLQLQQDLALLNQINAPLLILGGGSNILFTQQEIDAIVLHNKISGIRLVNENDNHVTLNIAAGENWHRLVRYTLNQNWSGLENLSLIPGCVGAAPIQNIGAYGVEIKDLLLELRAINLSTGKSITVRNDQCLFGYRDSIFKHKYKNQLLITDITLQLNKIPDLKLDYAGIRQQLTDMGIEKPTPTDVSNAIINIRQRKLPDPADIGNAGSFFKNPLIDTTRYNNIKLSYPNIPSYQIDTNSHKIPAAWLIDQCGFKGKRYGNIGVHKNQPLVLVNHGKGKGSDIAKLANTIRQSVLDTFQINLETEVNIL